MFRLLLLLAVIAGGVYYYYTIHPEAFGGTGNSAMGTINSDVNKAEGKARSLR